MLRPAQFQCLTSFQGQGHDFWVFEVETSSACCCRKCWSYGTSCMTSCSTWRRKTLCRQQMAPLGKRYRKDESSSSSTLKLVLRRHLKLPVRQLGPARNHAPRGAKAEKIWCFQWLSLPRKNLHPYIFYWILGNIWYLFLVCFQSFNWEKLFVMVEYF